MERSETLESAILREIGEEAGVDCRIHGIVGVRHRLYVTAGTAVASENSIYVVFKLEMASPEAVPNPDGVETDAAAFLSGPEIEELTPYGPELRLPCRQRDLHTAALLRMRMHQLDHARAGREESDLSRTMDCIFAR